MRLAFLNTWRRSVHRLSGGRTGHLPLPAAAVRVEALEDRALPSTGAPIVPTVVPPTNWIVYQQITQPDGKIVIVGTAADFAKNPSDLDASDFAVARYNPDGSLDTTFGNGGMVLTAINGGRDAAYDVVVQPDGKLVVVGTAGSFVTWDHSASGTGGAPTMTDYYTDVGGFALVRYNADGSLDTTFGNGGEVITPFYLDGNFPPGSGDALAVALQPDGSLVVGGTAAGIIPNGDTTPGFLDAACEFTVARYSADGTLDDSFGNGGVVQLTFGGIDAVNSLTIEPDGKILATGTSAQNLFFPSIVVVGPDGPIWPTWPPSYTLPVCVLLNPDGSQDTSCGDGGTGQPQDPGDGGGGTLTPEDGAPLPGIILPGFQQLPAIAEGAIGVPTTGSPAGPEPGVGNVSALPAANGSGATGGGAASVSPPPVAQHVGANQLAGMMGGQSVQASPLPTGGPTQTVTNSAPSIVVGNPPNGAPTPGANAIGNSRLGPAEPTSAEGGVDGDILAPPEPLIESGDGVAALRDDYFAQLPSPSGVPAAVDEAAPIDAWLAAAAFIVVPPVLPVIGSGASRRRRPLRGASRA